MFEGDPETEAIVLLGAIGGRPEHDEANFISHHTEKQVIALIVGYTAPERAQMGHAGAIIEGEEGTAPSQIAVLEKAGATIPRSSLDIPAF